jgi:hypothetical protein
LRMPGGGFSAVSTTELCKFNREPGRI